MVERRVRVPVLDVAQELGRPVGVRALRADAVHGPYADHLRPAHDTIAQVAGTAAGYCGCGHQALLEPTLPARLAHTSGGLHIPAGENKVAGALCGGGLLLDGNPPPPPPPPRTR